MTRVVFMGTPEFAVPSLRALVTHPDFDVVGVVTQPDRPAGRGGKLRESAVKKETLAQGLHFYQPETLRTNEAVAHIAAWGPDVIVVAAFGQILKPKVLNIPPHGCLNVHASLLPRWRGASPINAAIEAGDGVSGVTIMKMDAGMDTGPILLQKRTAIAPRETAETLHDRLAELGAEALIEVLPPYLAGVLDPQPQPPRDDEAVTYAKLLSREDGAIDWFAPAVIIDQKIRAYTPWPGAFTTWEGDLLKILEAHPAAGSAGPGQVIEYGGEIAVGTGAGLLVLDTIQAAGGRAMDAGAFVNGHPDLIGAHLGTKA
jgi:methionyl-tRNA formyltransferase